MLSHPDPLFCCALSLQRKPLLVIEQPLFLCLQFLSPSFIQQNCQAPHLSLSSPGQCVKSTGGRAPTLQFFGVYIPEGIPDNIANVAIVIILDHKDLNWSQERPAEARSSWEGEGRAAW